jgi:MraZ protein
VANRSWYQGDGIGLVDDKGRVAIPAALRQTLSANAPKADGKHGGTVVIGAHQKSKCLVAYDPGYLDVLTAKLEKREAEHTADDGELDYNIKRRAASGEAVPFDGSGRFIMPAFRASMPASASMHSSMACSITSRSGTPRRWSRPTRYQTS